ncbi:MAG: Hpt domain-containing protein [Bacilli bacterium]|nr:Hpt domain-containing protein [Bacilli bacterium]
MLTIEGLKIFGADVEEGLKRCVNKEALYLKLVATVPGNDGFTKLPKAIENHDLEAAFQAAHGLKGIILNLALTPFASPVIEMTEHLRAKEDIDYSSYLAKIEEKRAALEELCK